MISELTNSIKKNWHHLKQDDVCREGELSFTKFCQRVAAPHTKVLFLVTYKKKPLCIIKIMRDSVYNAKLEHEARAQNTIFELGLSAVPEVYFEDTVGDLFIYAEEVIEGIPISRTRAAQQEETILGFVVAFPSYQEIHTRSIAEIFGTHFSEKDDRIQGYIDSLRERDVALKTGLTHSDFGRPNILYSRRGIRIIDWERAGERPFWLIDGVYFLVRLYRIRNTEEWHTKAAPILARHTNINEEYAAALYETLMLFEKCYRKYPEVYKKVTADFKL